MKRARHPKLRWLVTAAALAPAGCGGPANEASGYLPPPPRIVEVEMDEFSFRHPSKMPAGYLVLRPRNTGGLVHRATLFAPGDDVPPLREQLRGDHRRIVAPIAQGPAQRPGETSAFAAELIPGKRYGVICLVVDIDNQLHGVKGMVSEFRTEADPKYQSESG